MTSILEGLWSRRGGSAARPDRTSGSSLRLPALLLLGALPAVLPAPLAAQNPPDSIPPVGADTLEQAPDTLEQAADSVPPPVRNLPEFGVFGSPETPGLVRWDLADIQGARALTLMELLEDVPGLTPVRGGDFGAPQSLVDGGMGAGRMRVFVDGVEELALDGSQVDLARIPLAGIGRIALRREGGELRLDLETERVDDSRPATRITAGTGDLETNFFRGTFLHPSAFGGAIGVGIERIDTRGPRGEEEGSLQGIWLRYLRPVGPVTLSAEMRRGITENSVLSVGAAESARNTWNIRARTGDPDGLRGEVYWAKTGLELDGGQDLLGRAAANGSRSLGQLGARGAWRGMLGDAGHLWIRGEARLFMAGHVDVGGDPRRDSIADAAGVDTPQPRPSDRFDLDLGLDLPAVGGASLRLGTDGWDQGRQSIAGLRGWTAPFHGVSVFGEIDRGDRGWRPPFRRLPADSAAADSVAATPFPDARFTDLERFRAGARLGWGPLAVSAAYLRTSTDSILPIGTADRSGLVPRRDSMGMAPAFPGDDVNGFEASARLAIPWVEGLSVIGSWRRWDTIGIYRPEQTYRGGLDYANTFYESESLGIRASFLVEGRDPMLVPVADPEFVAPDDAPGALPPPLRVPFYQSWNAHLQIRVMTVRIFIRSENVFGRSNLQDLPGRILPATRAMYGVRWTLFN